MITNFELIYEAIDPRRALLGLGALGGGLYGAYTLGNIGDTVAGIHNLTAQATPKEREEIFNSIQQYPTAWGEKILSGEMADRLNLKSNQLDPQQGSQLVDARAKGSAIGSLAGLGLGGLAGAGLTRLVIGKDPSKQKK